MTSDTASLPVNRRDFIVRCAKTGIALAAAGGLGYAAYDPHPPGADPHSRAAVTLPDFSIPGQKGRLAVARGEDRTKTLPAALKALGGMEAFIHKGDRVLIKVNAAFTSPPLLGATTHPDLVYGIVRLCREAGAAEVRITDNPINAPQACFALTGIGDAVQRAGGKLRLPDAEAFRPTTLAGGELIRNWPLLYAPFHDIDKLINAAPVKDHHRSGASLGMKNWYGLLGGNRNIFHQDIHNIIKELAMLVRPTLTILDGTTSMTTNGPTGGSLSDLKATHTLMAGTDPVALDALAASLLNKTVDDLPFIRKAEQMGIGTADYTRLNPVYVPSIEAG